ncbi:CHAT domain-containing protein [Amycolatopsis sp. Hca4]|uniref:CHAT domain-containing protein n=1 Tax=Amycolatopsis sp. Hca4 TaxID=2742131 RepID=UPI00159009C3|nr:CHAT domain-containing protein [Amycolatopsis sp. Hca4]QKV74885.1 CHAT domain-containing protein [Amycolatopsis sp. Hca4]
MEEDEWRDWAAVVAPHLSSLLGVDAAERVGRELTLALALPLGPAKAELRRILTGHAEVRAWIRRQRELRRGGYRSVASTETVAQRHLAVDFPDQASLGAKIPLMVQVVRFPGDERSAPLKPFVLDGPATLNISVSAGPGLVGLGDLDQDLVVPVAADSDQLRFAFTLIAPGLHRVTVRAFLAGTCLGEFRAEVSVAEGAPSRHPGIRTAELRQIVREPGEVTMEVSACAGGYAFRLVCQTPYERVYSPRRGPDVAVVVDQVAAEIRNLVGNRPVFDDPVLVKRRLVHLGAGLWNDVVPPMIQKQFWAQLPAIRSFSVISELDTSPWELFYSAEADSGKFLVERFPVVRRVSGQDHHPRQLRLSNAGFVIPPKSPPEAEDEVAAIRGKIGPVVADRGVIADCRRLGDLIDEGGFDLLHFACHNTFRADTGSAIQLDGGPFRPSDLDLAVQRRTFEDVGPIVFVNACRSAGEVATLTGTSGWATRFMRSGAAAFVGSSWAVRSESAMKFAEAFYEALLAGKQSLGEASMTARTAVIADGSDPTWLSYTIYGNPAAAVEVVDTL